MCDLTEGVLEDGGSRKSLVGSQRESSKRGRVGDQEIAVVLEWEREGYCQTILTQNWTEQLFCLTSIVFAGKHLRSQDAIEEMT